MAHKKLHFRWVEDDKGRVQNAFLRAIEAMPEASDRVFYGLWRLLPDYRALWGQPRSERCTVSAGSLGRRKWSLVAVGGGAEPGPQGMDFGNGVFALYAKTKQPAWPDRFYLGACAGGAVPHGELLESRTAWKFTRETPSEFGERAVDELRQEIADYTVCKAQRAACDCP